jgi:hypothetical protein
MWLPVFESLGISVPIVADLMLLRPPMVTYQTRSGLIYLRGISCVDAIRSSMSAI